MARWAHDDRVERSLASRLDRSKERQRVEMFHRLRENQAEVAKRLAMKLIEAQLIETNSKKEIEDQLQGAIEKLLEAEEFDVNYSIAPYRQVAPNPNLAALYLTSFVIEKLIHHSSVVDVYGSDEEIYKAIFAQLQPFLTRRPKDQA